MFKPPFMPLYWNDFLADNKVRVMTNEELGAYFRLLGAAWQEDIPGTLPADDDVLARLAGAELSLWRKLSRRVLFCFTLNEQSGRYEQKRMMAEHARAVAQMQMKHDRAAAGAEKRWGRKPEESPPPAQPMLKHGLSNASQNQNQKPALPPSREAVIAEAVSLGIPPDFSGLVFDDWQSRDGRDGGGLAVAYPAYVQKRWNRERVEWEAGTHRGKPKQEKTHESRQRTTAASHGQPATINRNAGTANGGATSDYRSVGKVRVPQPVQDPR